MGDASPTSNPFPGMDPYLQQRWQGFHSQLVVALSNHLGPLLPKGLFAEPQQYVYVQTADDTDGFAPDVQVVQRPPTATEREPVAGAVAVSEPVMIRVPLLEVRHHYVEVYEGSSGGRVLTAIEVVSPSNKHSAQGRKQYLQKQRELRRGRVSLVELDLVRGGRSITAARDPFVPPAQRATYHVVVRRAWRQDTIEYYACPLRARLPVIRVPLRKADADVGVDLQHIVDRIYVEGLYAEKLSHARPLKPRLSPEDAEWATGRLAAAGLPPRA